MDALKISNAGISRLTESLDSGERGEKASPDFAKTMAEALARIDQSQVAAEQQAKGVAAGEGNLVEAMLALSRADLSLRFAVAVRNKALEAYQEIMRLQV